METSKPITLSEKTWQFLRSALAGLDPRELKDLAAELGYESEDPTTAIQERPAAFLWHLGIHKQPELLAGTVIELADGTEYLIEKPAAEQIAAGEALLTLRLADDGERAVPRSEVEQAFRSHAAIDQVG